MVVRLVAEGDALLPQLRQPLAVDLDTGGSGSRGVVTEDIAHVVEQPGGGQQDGGRLLFAALHAFHKKFCVGVAVTPRRREPFVGGVHVLRNALPHEGHAATQISLCVTGHLATDAGTDRGAV